jgi:periplasmic divalent cation tolerance protein
VTSAVVVLSTAGSPDEAERIATALVDERLAACVNIVPSVTSIYRWQGAVEHATEVLMVMKTRRALAKRLVDRLQQLHSYDVPEAIVLPIDAGSRPYLDWVFGETAPPTKSPRRRARR